MLEAVLETCRCDADPLSHNETLTLFQDCFPQHIQHMHHLAYAHLDPLSQESVDQMLQKAEPSLAEMSSATPEDLAFLEAVQASCHEGYVHRLVKAMIDAAGRAVEAMRTLSADREAERQRAAFAPREQPADAPPSGVAASPISQFQAQLQAIAQAGLPAAGSAGIPEWGTQLMQVMGRLLCEKDADQRRRQSDSNASGLGAADVQRAEDAAIQRGLKTLLADHRVRRGDVSLLDTRLFAPPLAIKHLRTEVLETLKANSAAPGQSKKRVLHISREPQTAYAPRWTGQGLPKVEQTAARQTRQTRRNFDTWLLDVFGFWASHALVPELHISAMTVSVHILMLLRLAEQKGSPYAWYLEEETLRFARESEDHGREVDLERLLTDPPDNICLWCEQRIAEASKAAAAASAAAAADQQRAAGGVLPKAAAAPPAGPPPSAAVLGAPPAQVQGPALDLTQTICFRHDPAGGKECPTRPPLGSCPRRHLDTASSAGRSAFDAAMAAHYRRPPKAAAPVKPPGSAGSGGGGGGTGGGGGGGGKSKKKGRK